MISKLASPALGFKSLNIQLARLHAFLIFILLQGIQGGAAMAFPKHYPHNTPLR